MTIPPGAEAGVHPLDFVQYEDGTWKPVAGAITEEALVCLHVNGREVATFMCTPRRLEELALGFLRAEGWINGLGEIRALTISADGQCVDVWLDHPVPEPLRRIITSGCGGGLSFDDLRAERAPLNTHTTVSPAQLFERMRDLYRAAGLYGITQGIHTSALSDGQRLLLVAEDIGRHNTIDRLWGRAMQDGLDTEGLILLATGRISSEMLGKAARMGVPIVASRTSATSLSVTLGRVWNITVVGYVRRGSLRVYANPERIRPSPAPAA